MSLTSALLAGVTGLSANSSALSAISDNISNVNTDGYKLNQVDFEDLVTQSNATGTYTAGGVSTVNQQFVSEQGALTQTTSPTDLAISGQGLFVTTQAPTTIGATTPVLFTRSGSFTPDSQGYLKNPDGLYLQAYPADAQGNILNGSSSLSSLKPVNVDSIGGAVSATTTAGINANLNGSQPLSTASIAAANIISGSGSTAGAYDPTTNSMAAYNATTGTGVKPDFSIQVPISDSQGAQHTLQYDFLKNGTTPNTWNVEIQAVPASDIVTAGVAGQIATGTVVFNSDGSLDAAASTLPTSLTIGASSAGAPGAGRGQLGRLPGRRGPAHQRQPEPRRGHQRPDAICRRLGRGIDQRQWHAVRSAKLGGDQYRGRYHRDLLQRHQPGDRPGGPGDLPQCGRPNLDQR